ncbi:hypothetical protein C8P67_11184 [Flavobacterium aquicola]|uniref:Uncharacterized protein n=1 Tax=Flavobacterium aquicola TaxID=1682742 RepID=A0A3E0ECY8_9FLAO|nr:hypothetical protein C8P67_11184 [Flavobacterium aquicola]
MKNRTEKNLKKIIHSIPIKDSYYGLIIIKNSQNYFCNSPEKSVLTSFPAKPSATPL